MGAWPVNGFGPGIDLPRYARARPPVHAAAIETFRGLVGLSGRVSRALDTGCGTGESTVALTDVADRVVGLDVSPDMLRHTPAHPRVGYVQAVAEAMPFAAGVFDLITAAMAFHWFEAETFLAETRRLLRPSGWLVIYTSGFTGEMTEDAGFGRWFRDAYVGPVRPARRALGVIAPSRADAHGLTLEAEQPFADEISMTADQLLDYEASTTNILRVADRRGGTLDEATAWMREAVSPFFTDRPRGTFQFRGTVWVLTRR